LMLSFDLVILTGLLGIALYFVIPRLLTRIEGAPLLIDDLKQRREELQRELADLGSSPPEAVRSLVREKLLPRFVSLGFLLRQYFKRETLEAMLESATNEFKDDLSGLSDAKDATRVRRAIEAAATMRRVDALIYLHKSLKLWLPPHVATTSLMLALMIVHIIQVIYYAAR